MGREEGRNTGEKERGREDSVTIASIEEELGPACGGPVCIAGSIAGASGTGAGSLAKGPGLRRSSAWHRTWNVASAQGMLAWLGVAGDGVLTAGIGPSEGLSLRCGEVSTACSQPCPPLCLELTGPWGNVNVFRSQFSPP